MTTTTRKQYMDGEVTHSEHYAQFVDDQTLAWVKRNIGIARIKSSTDEVFNDIPLRIWDTYIIPGNMRTKLKEAGNVGISLSDAVCIAKEAARQIRTEG